MDRGLIGYTTTNGTTTSFTCPDGFPFRTGYTFPGDLKEYAHCQRFTSSTFTYTGYYVATECAGSSFLFTHWIVQGTRSMGYSGAWGCDGTCTSIEVYRFYNSGSGAGRQWLISCDQLLEFPRGVSTVFMKSPRSWATMSVESSPTREALATETEDNSIIESEANTTPTIASRPYRASETSSITPTEGGPDNGRRSTGLVAGAIVGSLIGLAVIIGCLIMAFRMGKKSQKGGRNHRCGLRSFPRLSISWTPRKPKESVPTVYPIVISNDQPGLIPTMEDMNPNLPPTYIYGSNRTELATVRMQNGEQYLSSQTEPQQVHPATDNIQNRVSELPSARL